MKHGMHKNMKRKNYMGGMKVEKVDGIMDGNKAARRESNSDNKRKPMKNLNQNQNLLLVKDAVEQITQPIDVMLLQMLWVMKYLRMNQMNPKKKKVGHVPNVVKCLIHTKGQVIMKDSIVKK